MANSDTHGVGAGLSVAALVVLEFTASTLYHAFPQPRVKHVFKILDHARIYLLIAGTYTPFILVTFWVCRPKWVSVVVYLAMGWLVVEAVGPLTANLDRAVCDVRTHT